MSTRDAAAIEAAVSVVPGVSRAVVVAGPYGTPDVLRVVLDHEVDALGVARAAERILRLQFGVGLDPGRLEIVENTGSAPPTSVLRLVEEDDEGMLLLGEETEILGEDVDALLAELEPGPGPRFDRAVLESAARHPAGLGVDRPAAPRVPAQPRRAYAVPDRPRRISVSQLVLSADGLGVTATVTLTHDGVEHVGSCEGPSTPAALHRAVATATLRALGGMLAPGLRLDVDSLSMAPMGDTTVALVRVIWATTEGVEHLTGSSEVQGDARRAVIRATLDAVNRRLALDVADS